MERCLPGLQTFAFSLGPGMTDGEGALWLLLTRALSPFMRLHPHDLISTQSPISKHHIVWIWGYTNILSTASFKQWLSKLRDGECSPTTTINMPPVITSPWAQWLFFSTHKLSLPAAQTFTKSSVNVRILSLLIATHSQENPLLSSKIKVHFACFIVWPNKWIK